MDDDDEVLQRVVALKRACADVILNTSKEAAARVMEWEKKSEQLEHELRSTKDEAIQMMLRQRKMMDDKINEAKNTSRNQQEKIDELEAQLQEAEDIVSELRKELRYVQAKNERVARNDEQHLDKHEIATSEVAFEENRQYISQSISCPLQLQKFSLVTSDMENSYLNQSPEYPKCPNQLTQMRNSYGTKPELPSIILRSKKNMFCRNGFTQRIHACGRNVLDSKLSLLRQPSSGSNKGKEGEKADVSTCKATPDQVDKMFDIGSKDAMHKDDNTSFWYKVEAMNLIPEKGKTTPKYKKDKSSLRKKNPHKLFMKVNGIPGDPTRKSVKNNTQPNHDPSPIAPKLSSNIAGIATQPECANTAEINENNDKGYIGKMISNSKGESPVDISVPIFPEGALIKNSDIQVCKLNLEKIKQPVHHCELKTTDATSEGPILPVAKGIITFKRRRKSETVSIGEGNASAEINTPVTKKVRQNNTAELENSRFVSQSPLEKTC